jgi:hypothetical protein
VPGYVAALAVPPVLRQILLYPESIDKQIAQE